MNQLGIFNYFHGINDLRDDQSVEVQGLSLVVVFFDKIEDREREELKDYAEMFPEDKEVKHSDDRIFSIWVVYSV